MKIKDLATSAFGVLINVKAYAQFKLHQEVGSQRVTAFAMLVWSVFFITMATKLVHLAGYTSPLQEMQKDFDRRDIFYQVVANKGKLSIAQLDKLYSVGTRPIVKRTEVFISEDPCAQQSSSWWEKIFITLGFQKIWAICLSGTGITDNGLPVYPAGIVGSNREDLQEEIEILENDSEVVSEIARDQKIIRESIVNEVRIGTGFVRLVFEHIQVGELANNESFLLLFFSTLVLTFVLTFHYSAKAFKSHQTFRHALDLGFRNFATWIIILGVLNVLPSLVGTIEVPLITHENPEYVARVAVGLVGLALFIIPSVLAWKRSYELSWLKFCGVVMACVPLSVIFGVAVFAPIVYVIATYHDVFSIFI